MGLFWSVFFISYSIFVLYKRNILKSKHIYIFLLLRHCELSFFSFFLSLISHTTTCHNIPTGKNQICHALRLLYSTPFDYYFYSWTMFKGILFFLLLLRFCPKKKKKCTYICWDKIAYQLRKVPTLYLCIWFSLSSFRNLVFPSVVPDHSDRRF